MLLSNEEKYKILFLRSFYYVIYNIYTATLVFACSEMVCLHLNSVRQLFKLTADEFTAVSKSIIFIAKNDIFTLKIL